MADLSRELVEFQRHPSGDGPVAERLARAVATPGAPMVSISLFYDLRSGLSRRLDEPYPVCSGSGTEAPLARPRSILIPPWVYSRRMMTQVIASGESR